MDRESRRWGFRFNVMGASVLAFLLVAGCGDDDDVQAPVVDVTLANLNIVHGLGCPGDCRVGDRVELFFDWLESIDCPDVVTLQEILTDAIRDEVLAGAATRCDGVYAVFEPQRRQNVTLSRHPVLQTNEDELFNFLPGVRILWHVRLDHPSGLVDVFNTHFAAGIDRGSDPCQEPCPPACVAAGAVSNRDCQAVEVANLVEQHAAPGSLRILAGDFNATPESFTYDYLVRQKDWTDSYLVAGNPECDASTGTGCTSGREDETLDDLESSANGVDRRIDYAFVQLPDNSGDCRFEIDSAADRDRDGLATKIFADDPNPFADACGPLPDPICWPSDHEGMQLDLNCY